MALGRTAAGDRAGPELIVQCGGVQAETRKAGTGAGLSAARPCGG